jgi:hypothetical protein
MAKLPVTIDGADFGTLPFASRDEVKSAFARVPADTLAQASFRVESR